MKIFKIEMKILANIFLSLLPFFGTCNLKNKIYHFPWLKLLKEQ